MTEIKLPVSVKALEDIRDVARMITVGNIFYHKDIGDLYGWCERVRNAIEVALNTAAPAPVTDEAVTELQVPTGRPSEEAARSAVEAWLNEVAPGYPDYSLHEDGDGWCFYIAERDTTSYLNHDLTVEWYGTGWPDYFQYDEGTGEWFATIKVAPPTPAASTAAPQPAPFAGGGLPQDMIDLVIAGREAFDTGHLPSAEQHALDKALEPFSSRVRYENEPDEDSLSNHGGGDD